MFYLQGALKRGEKEHCKSSQDNTFFKLMKECTTKIACFQERTSIIKLLKSSRDGAFADLDSLETLKLEDNSLIRLSGEDLFPTTLKVSKVCSLKKVVELCGAGSRANLLKLQMGAQRHAGPLSQKKSHFNQGALV